MDPRDDRLENLLAAYQQRKQDETRRQVERALRVEETRTRGADALRRAALAPLRDAAERLRIAGHEVVYQEMLDAYPPGLRLHLWPRPGPLDTTRPRRATFELVWGDPEPDALCARRWTSEGLDRLHDQGSAGADTLDELWVREQVIEFVGAALAG